MQSERIAIEFLIGGSKSKLISNFSVPTQEGDDWCCILSVPGLVSHQKFYGTSQLEAILNTVNFVSSLVTDPPRLLLSKLGADSAEGLSVQFMMSE